MHETPMLDQLESGPWPSFVTGLKRLAKDNDMMVDLLGQLETSYQTRKGYWKGGTVGVIGYGGGVIPRFTELKDSDGKPKFPAASEFHTLRIMPPPGMHYDTGTMRKFCDIWEKYGSGLIAFHGQSGDIMFQGISTENVQPAFDELNEMGFDLGGAGPAVRTGMSCVGAARCEHSCVDEGRTMRTLVNNALDDMHRPALPYKFKYKVSGCPNDCMNSVQRAAPTQDIEVRTAGPAPPRSKPSSLISSKACCTFSVVAPWNMMSPDWPWNAIRPEPCFSQMLHMSRSTLVS